MLTKGHIRFNVAFEKKPQNKEEKKLEKLMSYTYKPILRIKSINPLEFDHDEISIDRNKVNIVDREIFGANESHSYPIEEVASVTVDTTPFFASMHFTFKSSTTPSITIKFLKNKEAILMRKLIEGLRIARMNGIDLLKIDNNTLLKQATEIGRIEKTKY